MSFFSRRPTGSPASSLVSFYEGTGRDHRGRRLSEILQWGAGRLELSHDYIQTLFPLPEESGVNWSAPIIDRQVFDAFRSRPELREKLRDAFEKILWFYGFKLDEKNGEVKVSKGDNYDENSENWNTRFDHNHLRITRIIRCLRVLGLEDEAKAFHSTLEDSTTRVSSRSREFWRRAAERALNLRPDLEIDDESDATIGPMFLREFELERKGKLAETGRPTLTEDQTGLEASDEHQGEKEEQNGLDENEEASNKLYQSGLEESEAKEAVENEKTYLIERDNTADILDLERAQDHEVTDDKKKQDSTS